MCDITSFFRALIMELKPRNRSTGLLTCSKKPTVNATIIPNLGWFYCIFLSCGAFQSFLSLNDRTFPTLKKEKPSGNHACGCANKLRKVTSVECKRAKHNPGPINLLRFVFSGISIQNNSRLP